MREERRHSLQIITNEKPNTFYGVLGESGSWSFLLFEPLAVGRLENMS